MGFRFPSKKHGKKLSALSLEVFWNSSAAIWVVNNTQRCGDVLWSVDCGDGGGDDVCFLTGAKTNHFLALPA